MKAICINNKTESYSNYKGQKEVSEVVGLTEGQEYEVEQSKEYDNYYEVQKNNLGAKKNYRKDRFKPVEPQKEEKKEYTFEEVVVNIKDGEKYKNTRGTWVIKLISKEGDKIKYEFSGKEIDYIVTTPYQRFTKVEEPKQVSTTECYQKECSGNKENQCIVTDRICTSRKTEPINYEEKYNKLKEEYELLLKEKNWKSSTLIQFNNLRYENSQYERINKELVEQRDNLKKNISTYYDEVTEKSKIIDVKVMENSKLTVENMKLKEEINNLKSNMNLISKCEENESLKAIIKCLASLLQEG